MSADSSPSYYIKTWVLLLVLFVISVLGPMLEMPVLTLITAFGIAIVKAYIVAARFMHLNVEKKYISYMLLMMLVFVFLFFFGVAPDSMNYEGRNWSQTWRTPELLESRDGGGEGHH